MESQAILSKFWVYKKFILMRFIDKTSYWADTTQMVKVQF